MYFNVIDLATDEIIEKCYDSYTANEIVERYDGDAYVDKIISCRVCDAQGYEHHDHYGISTGYWCDEHFESDKYPYRRDAYFDSSNYGERMEDDY